jgi:hypothetical protein
MSLGWIDPIFLMGVRSLLDVLGPEIDDPEEGTKVQVTSILGAKD